MKADKYKYLRFSFKSEMCELMSEHTYCIGVDYEHGLIFVKAARDGYALIKLRGTRRYIKIQTKMFSNHEDELVGEYTCLGEENGALIFERGCEYG